MTPPRNLERRHALTDAAIELLGTCGIHQLSHRAVDEASNLPPGTTSNYFKTRDNLLEAVARRVVDLQLADMAQSGSIVTEQVSPEGLATLIGGALYAAATLDRTRLLAIYELYLEATRRPALLETLATMATSSLDATVAHHRALGLRTSPDQVLALITLFGGTLFVLATSPPESVTAEGANVLARCIVSGVLSELAEAPIGPAD